MTMNSVDRTASDGDICTFGPFYGLKISRHMLKVTQSARDTLHLRRQQIHDCDLSPRILGGQGRQRSEAYGWSPSRSLVI